MKTTPRIIITAILISSPFLTSAQNLDEGSNADSDGEIYTLSPFEVQADEDAGYMATSSLAGTRLNSELKNLGSSISVITPEFLEDADARDINELLVYTTSTESAGVSGNFTNSSFTGAGSRPEQDGVRGDPEGGTRIRGLARAELSVDYFITEFGSDSYNIKRVDISRGPNSVLFGVGSPGGVINTTLKKALLKSEFGRVSYSIGEYSSYRATIDYNKPLIKDRLGIRINILDEEQNHRQKPTFTEDTRLHIAMTGVLRENADGLLGSNTVRLSYEKASLDTAPPTVIPPTDNLQWWYAPPSNVEQIESTTGLEFPAHYKDGTYQSQAMYDIFGSNAEVLSAPTRQPFFSGIGVIFNNALTDQYALTGFTDPEFSNLQAHLSNVPAGFNVEPFPWTVNTALVEGGFMPGYTAETLTDTTLYDFVNYHIWGDYEQRHDDFENFSAVVEQLFFNNSLGVELSYNNQKFDRSRNFTFTDFRSKDLWIDNNLWLGNGQPNPNAGRPMLVSRQLGVVEPRESVRETYRATAFYDLNLEKRFQEGWGRWFGRHVFSGIAERVQRDFNVQEIELGPASNDVEVLGTHTSRYGGAAGRLHAAFYVGPDLRGVDYEDIRLTGYLRAPVIEAGDTFNGFYLNRQTGNIEEHTFFAQPYLDQLDMNQRVLDSKAVTWQSYFFNSNLVGLVGLRNDRVQQFNDFGLERYPIGHPIAGGFVPGSNMLNEEASLDAEDDTVTWSVVGHYPEDILPELPGGLQLSVFYSESENFQPTGFRQNVFLEPIGPPSGVTEERGFLITTKDNKYSLRANWFETSNNNIGGGGSLASNPTQAVFDSIRRSLDAQNSGLPFDVGSTGRTTGLVTAGYNSYEEFHEALIDVVPEPFKSAVNPVLLNDGVTVSLQTDPIPGGGLTSAFDFRATGFEIEFVANPTDSWRLSLNAAKQETVQTNVGQDLGRYYDEMVQNYINANLWDTEILEEPAIGTSNVTLRSRFLDRHANRLAAFRSRDGTINQEQRKWRVNFLTSYEFKESIPFLKGLTAGGGVRWQSKAAVGYPLLLQTLETGDLLQVPDLDNPFYNDAIWNGDVFLKYSRELKDGKDWIISLRLKNYLGNDDLIPELVNPDGSLAVVRIPQERRWTITNTFKF